MDGVYSEVEGVVLKCSTENKEDKLVRLKENASKLLQQAHEETHVHKRRYV